MMGFYQETFCQVFSIARILRGFCDGFSVPAHEERFKGPRICSPTLPSPLPFPCVCRVMPWLCQRSERERNRWMLSDHLLLPFDPTRSFTHTRARARARARTHTHTHTYIPLSVPALFEQGRKRESGEGRRKRRRREEGIDRRERKRGT